MTPQARAADIHRRMVEASERTKHLPPWARPLNLKLLLALRDEAREIGRDLGAMV